MYTISTAPKTKSRTFIYAKSCGKCPNEQTSTLMNYINLALLNFLHWCLSVFENWLKEVHFDVDSFFKFTFKKCLVDCMSQKFSCTANYGLFLLSKWNAANSSWSCRKIDFIHWTFMATIVGLFFLPRCSAFVTVGDATCTIADDVKIFRCFF